MSNPLISGNNSSFQNYISDFLQESGYSLSRLDGAVEQALPDETESRNTPQGHLNGQVEADEYIAFAFNFFDKYSLQQKSKFAKYFTERGLEEISFLQADGEFSSELTTQIKRELLGQDTTQPEKSLTFQASKITDPITDPKYIPAFIRRIYHNTRICLLSLSEQQDIIDDYVDFSLDTALDKDQLKNELFVQLKKRWRQGNTISKALAQLAVVKALELNAKVKNIQEALEKNQVLQKSRQLFRFAAELNPRNAAAQFLLADERLQEKDYATASHHLAEAVKGAVNPVEWINVQKKIQSIFKNQNISDQDKKALLDSHANAEVFIAANLIQVDRETEAIELLKPIRKEVSEADKILTNLELREINLAALDVWESFSEENFAYLQDAANGILGRAVGYLSEKLTGTRNQHIDEHKKQQALIAEVEKRLTNRSVNTLVEALTAIENDNSASIELREEAKGFSPTKGDIRHYLILYTAKLPPDDLAADLLLQAAFEMEYDYSAVTTPLATYELIHTLAAKGKIKTAALKNIEALTGKSSLARAALKFTFSMSPESVAVDLLTFSYAAKFANLAKLAAAQKLEKVGVIGYKALPFTFGTKVGVLSSGVFAGMTAKQAMTHDVEKVFAPGQLFKNYLGTLIMMGTCEVFGALGQAMAPRLAKFFGLMTEDSLSTGGKFMVGAIGHGSGLTGIITSSHINQGLKLNETPIGGPNESLVHDVYSYALYAGGHKLGDKISFGKLSAIANEGAPSTRINLLDRKKDLTPAKKTLFEEIKKLSEDLKIQEETQSTKRPPPSNLKEFLKNLSPARKDALAKYIQESKNLQHFMDTLPQFFPEEAPVVLDFLHQWIKGRPMGKPPTELGLRAKAQEFLENAIRKMKLDGNDPKYSDFKKEKDNPRWTLMEREFQVGRALLRLRNQLYKAKNLIEVREAILRSRLKQIHGWSTAEIAKRIQDIATHAKNGLQDLTPIAGIRQRVRDLIEQERYALHSKLSNEKTASDKKVKLSSTQKIIRHFVEKRNAIYEQVKKMGEVKGRDHAYSQEELQELLYQVLERGKDLIRITEANGLRNLVRDYQAKVVQEAEKLFPDHMNKELNSFSGESVNNLESRYRLAIHLMNQEMKLPVRGVPSPREVESLVDVVRKFLNKGLAADFNSAQSTLREHLDKGTAQAFEMLRSATLEEKEIMIDSYFGDYYRRDVAAGTAFRVATSLGLAGVYREVGVAYKMRGDVTRAVLSLGGLTFVSPESKYDDYFLLHTHPEEYLTSDGKIMGPKRGGPADRFGGGPEPTFQLGKETITNPDTRNSLPSHTDLRLFFNDAQSYWKEGYPQKLGDTPLFDTKNRIFRNWVMHPSGASEVNVKLTPQGKVEEICIRYTRREGEPMQRILQALGFQKSADYFNQSMNSLKELENTLGVPIRFEEVSPNDLTATLPFSLGETFLELFKSL